MTNLEMIYATKNVLWNQLYTSWITEELFSFPWWFSVFFLIVSYVIWWKLLDKSRLIELLLFGSLVAVMSIIIDTVADNLTLWQYKVKIFPFTPGFFPYHLSIAPLILMLVYQYTNNWRRYIIGTVFAGVIYCFVMIPLFVAIGEVQLYKWNHGYTLHYFYNTCHDRPLDSHALQTYSKLVPGTNGTFTQLSANLPTCCETIA